MLGTCYLLLAAYAGHLLWSPSSAVARTSMLTMARAWSFATAMFGTLFYWAVWVNILGDGAGSARPYLPGEVSIWASRVVDVGVIVAGFLWLTVTRYRYPWSRKGDSPW